MPGLNLGIGNMKEFQQIKDWLQLVPFLTKEDLDLFEPFLCLKKFDANQIMLSAGDVCRELCFVNSGLFRMYYLSDGKEINISFVFENEFVADYESFICQKPSRFFIEAMEASVVMPFSHELLMHAYSTSKNWERFGRMKAEEVARTTSGRVESFLSMEGKERYLQLVKERPYIFERVSLYHIASYLGMERESLSRIRKAIITEKRK